MISIWHKTGNLSVVLLDTQLLADVRSNFFFLMPVCSEFCKIQKYNFSVLILIPTLHSRSYGLIIYIAHMSPTLVSKKISELFKKPKKWSAHFPVGIIGDRLLSDCNDWYVFWKRKYLVKSESVKTLFCNLNQFNLY